MAVWNPRNATPPTRSRVRLPLSSITDPDITVTALEGEERIAWLHCRSAMRRLHYMHPQFDPRRAQALPAKQLGLWQARRYRDLAARWVGQPLSFPARPELKLPACDVEIVDA